ncbi:uncharacterized protein Dvir_GJ25846 [Drosophila virilis]|uniref:Uncharacterized protein n=1 Tax=Drosophila virilis TaxID=7244 RepID=A0A0Q9WWY4_DROVI|nr:uncharacterized protein Dvir_GJ25846 [Drosophila virilis]
MGISPTTSTHTNTTTAQATNTASAISLSVHSALKSDNSTRAASTSMASDRTATATKIENQKICCKKLLSDAYYQTTAASTFAAIQTPISSTVAINLATAAPANFGLEFVVPRSALVNMATPVNQAAKYIPLVDQQTTCVNITINKSTTPIDEEDSDIEIQLIKAGRGPFSANNALKIPAMQIDANQNNNEQLNHAPSTSRAAGLAAANKVAPDAAATTKKSTLADLLTKIASDKKLKGKVSKRHAIPDNSAKRIKMLEADISKAAANDAALSEELENLLGNGQQHELWVTDHPDEDMQIDAVDPVTDAPAPNITNVNVNNNTTVNHANSAGVDVRAPVPKVQKIKPAPLFIPFVPEIMPLIEGINDVIGEGTYATKPSAGQGLQVLCNDVDSYRKLVQYFQDNSIASHTYQLKHERGFKIIMRHLHRSTPADWIRTKLSDLGHKARFDACKQKESESVVKANVLLAQLGQPTLPVMRSRQRKRSQQRQQQPPKSVQQQDQRQRSKTRQRVHIDQQQQQQQQQTVNFAANSYASALRSGLPDMHSQKQQQQKLKRQTAQQQHRQSRPKQQQLPTRRQMDGQQTLARQQNRSRSCSTRRSATNLNTNCDIGQKLDTLITLMTEDRLRANSNVENKLDKLLNLLTNLTSCLMAKEQVTSKQNV